jgi:ROK family
MASKGHLPSTGDRPGRGSAAVLAGGHAYGGTLKRTEQKLSRPARPDKAAAALRTAADAIQSGSAAFARLAVVSAADPVDRATGRLVHLPDAPFLVGDLDPAEILAAYVDGPVIVDNDVNWAARAERDALAATPVSDFAYVFLGEGLGAARRNLPSSTSVRNCHVWDLAIDGDELMTVTSVGSLAWHLHTTGQTRCRVALDTALSSCSLSSRGGLAAVGGAAGVAVFRRMPVRRGL